MTKEVLRLTAIVGALFCFGSVQAQDDLQEYINRVAAARGLSTGAPADITVIDLSQFAATVREKTLDVANGRGFRFINGTLTRSGSLDGPIVHIGGGSYLEIGKEASVDAYESASRAEAILMDGGELMISEQGSVRGHRYTSQDAGHNITSNPFAAVRMTADHDIVTTKSSSSVYNAIVCEAKNATVNYDGGTMTADSHSDNFRSAANVNFLGGYGPNSYFQITLTEKANMITIPSNYDYLPPMGIYAPGKMADDIVITNCHSNFMKESWYLEKVVWEGDPKYRLRANYTDNTIRLSYDDLQDFIDGLYPYQPKPGWPCGCSWQEPVRFDVPCSGTKVKKDIEFPDDDLYWAINGRPEGLDDGYECEGEVDQGEHDVKVRPGAKVKISHVYWKGCGCQKHFYVWGTLYIEWRVWFYNYWRFIHLMPGGKIIIKDLYGDCEETVIYQEGGETEYSGGKCTGGKYGWYGMGGVIYIRGGWLGGNTGGGWTGPGCRVYIYDGTVQGGIHNYGYHYFYGGYCTGGGTYTIYNYRGGRFYYYGGSCSGGRIWNEGDMYVDGGGNIDCGGIYMGFGGRIFIIKKLTFDLNIYFEEKDIVLDETLILGGEGYTLTPEDCARIHLYLPDGYIWKYDPTRGGIVILKEQEESKDDLQDYINSVGAYASATVNLSQFKATERTTSLTITDGRRITFTNGTLSRAASDVGPVLIVSGGGSAIVSHDATITGGDKLNYDVMCEVVRLANGSLDVYGGTVVGAYANARQSAPVDGVPSPPSIFMGWGMQDAAVRMTTSADHFALTSGTLYGNLLCDATGAEILFNGGELKTVNFWQQSQSARASAPPQRLAASGWVDAEIVSYSDIHINSTIPYADIWGFDEIDISSPGQPSTKPTLTGDGFAITLMGRLPVVYVQKKLETKLRIIAGAKTDGDVLVQGEQYQLTTADKKIVTHRFSSEDNEESTLTLSGNSIVLGMDDLQPFIDEQYPYVPGGDQPCGCSWQEPVKLDIPCSGVEMKRDVEFPDDDLYWAINGRPEDQEDAYDCEGQIDEGEFDVRIPRDSKVKLRWLRWWGCGCQKHIYVWGTLYIEWRVWFYNYWRFIHVMPGGKLIIKDLTGECQETVIYQEGGETEYSGGSSKGGQYGWYCTGGDLYVYGGRLEGGTAGGWTGTGGRSYVYGGTVHGGIHNYGYHYFYDGYCTGGGAYTIYNYRGGRFYYYGGTCSNGGRIWNEGDLYVDGGGNIDCGIIYMVRGGRVCFVRRPTFVLNIVIDEENITLDESVCLGGEGYVLTEEDCKFVHIDLPDGYEWAYDATRHAIIVKVKTADAVRCVASDTVAGQKVYNLQGQQIKKPVKGQLYVREKKKYIEK